MAPSSLRPALQRRAPVWRSITAFDMSSSAPDLRRQARTCAEPLLSPLSIAPSGPGTRAGPVRLARTAPAATSCVRSRTIMYSRRRRASSSLVRGRSAAPDGTCSALRQSVRSVTQVSTDARVHMHPQPHMRGEFVLTTRSRATKATDTGQHVWSLILTSPSCSAEMVPCACRGTVRGVRTVLLSDFCENVPAVPQ